MSDPTPIFSISSEGQQDNPNYLEYVLKLSKEES